MGFEKKNVINIGKPGNKRRIMKLVNKGYYIIFHEEISLEVQSFLKNLLFVGIATVLSTLCISIFNVMGGRW